MAPLSDVLDDFTLLSDVLEALGAVKRWTPDLDELGVLQGLLDCITVICG